MVWPSYDASKLKPIEHKCQIRNHDMTILLRNQMLEQTITIDTFSKNSITSQTQEQWEIILANRRQRERKKIVLKEKHNSSARVLKVLVLNVHYTTTT